VHAEPNATTRPPSSATTLVPVSMMWRWIAEKTSSGGEGGGKPCRANSSPTASVNVACSAGRSSTAVGRSSTTATLEPRRSVEAELDQHQEHQAENQPGRNRDRDPARRHQP